MQDLAKVSDDELISRLDGLAGSERKAQVEILRHLTELDRRQVVVAMGYTGLWDYCRRRLKFSEATSMRRVNIARAASRFPEVLAMLEEGSLNLCSAADLVVGLNDDNAKDLLASAAGKSRKNVQRLVAPHADDSPARDVIRRVSAKAATATALQLSEPGPDSGVPSPTKPKAPAEPVLHRVAFTAGDDLVAKLEKLQELLGGATLAEVCDRAADLLLAKVDPAQRVARREARVRKAALVPKVRLAPSSEKASEPRRPPRALADRVLADAGQRCCYVSPTGVQCAATKHLTIDHIHPYALGGSSHDPENLRCYCSAHNLHAGREVFGHFHSESKLSIQADT